MRIILKRSARIWHKPGETLDVSPEEARHLCAIGSAVPAPAKPSAGKKPAEKKEKQSP